MSKRMLSSHGAVSWRVAVVTAVAIVVAVLALFSLTAGSEPGAEPAVPRLARATTTTFPDPLINRYGVDSECVRKQLELQDPLISRFGQPTAPRPDC